MSKYDPGSFEKFAYKKASPKISEMCDMHKGNFAISEMGSLTRV